MILLPWWYLAFPLLSAAEGVWRIPCFFLVFILFPLIWLYALGWTLWALIGDYGAHEGWWWISVPFSLIFPLVGLRDGLMGVVANTAPELLLLYGATLLVAPIWTLVTVLTLDTLSWTRWAWVRFGLGVVSTAVSAFMFLPADWQNRLLHFLHLPSQ